jgi:hypothetical protein
MDWVLGSSSFLQEKTKTAKAMAKVAMLNIRFVFLVMTFDFIIRGVEGEILV